MITKIAFAAAVLLFGGAQSELYFANPNGGGLEHGADVGQLITQRPLDQLHHGHDGRRRQRRALSAADGAAAAAADEDDGTKRSSRSSVITKELTPVEIGEFLAGFEAKESDESSAPSVVVGGGDTDEKKECIYFPEIVLVQDASSSFVDDLKNVKLLIPRLFELLHERYGENVKFGLASFVDKNVEGCGFAGNGVDYCAQLHIPLDTVNAKLEAAVMKVLDTLEISGGGDYLDGGNEALLRVAMSDSVGWSNNEYDESTGRPIVRMIIMATDAGFHEAEYALEMCNKYSRSSDDDDQATPVVLLPKNKIISNPELIKDDINAGCTDMDFPSDEDIYEALKSKNIIPIIFAGRSSFYTDEEGYEGWWQMSQFEEQVIERNNKTDEWSTDYDYSLSHFYGWYFSQVIGRDAIVHYLEDDSSNLFDIFDSALEDVDTLTCRSSSTTTPEPVVTVTPEEKKDGGSGGIAIGAASGAGLGAAGAAVLAAKKMGYLFNNSPAPDMNVAQDVDHVDTAQDREQFEAVTGDLFA